MCPICKNDNFKVIGLPVVGPKESKIIKSDYKVVQCKGCFIYYVEPQINFNKDEWEYLYDNNYFSKLTKWHEKRREKDRKSRFERIEKYKNGTIKNFLDVGCGEGYCLLEAIDRGWKAYGLDITDNRVLAAKKEDINFINQDLITAQLPDNYFDVVYVDSVLEHVNNPFEYLTEIKRVLKKDGILFFAVPNEDSLLNDVKKIIYKIADNKKSSRLKPFKSPYHIVGYNKESIKTILQKQGFKLCKLRNFATRLEFLKARVLSKEFLILLILLPIYILAVPLNREIYFEVFVKK